MDDLSDKAKSLLLCANPHLPWMRVPRSFSLTNGWSSEPRPEETELIQKGYLWPMLSTTTETTYRITWKAKKALEV